MEDIPKAIDSVYCPQCGMMISEKTLQFRGDMEYVEGPEFGMEWEETHLCLRCETVFIVKNSTL
jgi:hypothetical protein